MFSNTNIIYEKSKPLPIKKTSADIKQYSLKQNLFDPLKNSPPNEFMIKLHMRMSNYNSFCIKVESRESE